MLSTYPARYAPLLEAALRDLGSMASCGNVLRVARPGHRDGWGIVAYRRGKVVLYIRVTSIGADEDPRFSAVRGLCNFKFCLSVTRCLWCAARLLQCLWSRCPGMRGVWLAGNLVGPLIGCAMSLTPTSNEKRPKWTLVHRLQLL